MTVNMIFIAVVYILVWVILSLFFHNQVQLRVCKYCLGSVDVNSIPQIEEKRRTSKYMLFSPKLEREKEIPDVSPSDSVQV